MPVVATVNLLRSTPRWCTGTLSSHLFDEVLVVSPFTAASDAPEPPALDADCALSLEDQQRAVLMAIEAQEAEQALLYAKRMATRYELSRLWKDEPAAFDILELAGTARIGRPARVTSSLIPAGWWRCSVGRSRKHRWGRCLSRRWSCC